MKTQLRYLLELEVTRQYDNKELRKKQKTQASVRLIKKKKKKAESVVQRKRENDYHSRMIFFPFIFLGSHSDRIHCMNPVEETQRVSHVLSPC